MWHLFASAVPCTLNTEDPMNAKVAALVAVLAAGVIALSTALVVVAMTDDDSSSNGAAQNYGMPMMGQPSYTYDQMQQMMRDGTWRGMDPQGSASSGYMWDHMRWMMGGFTTGSTALTEGAADQTISMQNFAFSPGNVHVPVGAKVTWKNEDDAPHIATSSDGTWTTPNVLNGQSATITFDKSGDYVYICTYHPGMTGRLLVQ